jgi:hypothetical protein
VAAAVVCHPCALLWLAAGTARSAHSVVPPPPPLCVVGRGVG